MTFPKLRRAGFQTAYTYLRFGRRAIRRFLEGVRSIRLQTSFEDHFGTWDEAMERTSGYGEVEILDKVLAASLAVHAGEAVHERDSVTFDKIQYTWPVLAALMWSAARNAGSLRVIDLGGSLGTAYRQNRRFISQLDDVSWAVVEQPSFVAEGRKHFADARLTFFDSIGDAVEMVKPQVAIVGCALQYLPDPNAALEQLSASGIDTLIFDRTPVHQGVDDRIVLQHVPPQIYPATYPAWIFSKSCLLSMLGHHGWRIVEEFASPEGPMCTSGGLNFDWVGIICVRGEN